MALNNYYLINAFGVVIRITSSLHYLTLPVITTCTYALLNNYLG